MAQAKFIAQFSAVTSAQIDDINQEVGDWTTELQIVAIGQFTRTISGWPGSNLPVDLTMNTLQTNDPEEERRKFNSVLAVLGFEFPSPNTGMMMMAAQPAETDTRIEVKKKKSGKKPTS